MFTAIIQLVVNKLKPLLSYFTSIFELIKYVSLSDNKDDDNNNSKTNGLKDTNTLEDLFSKPSVYKNFKPTSKTLKSCAVSEFDYDFSSSNPFNWDFQHLVLENQGHSNEETKNDADSKTNGNANLSQTLNRSISSNSVECNLNFDLVLPTNNNINTNINHNNSNTANHTTSINENLSVPAPTDILNQFSSNFQNQLRTTELIQIYKNQNNLQYQTNQEGEFTDDDDDDDEYENIHHGIHETQHTHDDYLKQNLHSSTYIKPAFESDSEDDQDALPLDQELLLSYLRSSNMHHAYNDDADNNNKFNTRTAYNTISDLSEGNTVSPHTATSDSISYQSPLSNQQKIENVSETSSNKRGTSFGDPFSSSNNDDEPYSIKKIADDDGPRKKFRKLSVKSKPSSSKNSSSSSPTDCDSTLSSNLENKPTKDEFDEHDKKSGKEKLYTCAVCDATFKVKGYLTRHQKKHFKAKPLQCPYFESSIDTDGVKTTGDEVSTTKIPRCHPTGGFSRRDTLKTHLKALHFVYPTGTKSGDRNNKKGRCAACFKEFNTNQEWLEQHVMTNQCAGMITKYK